MIRGKSTNLLATGGVFFLSFLLNGCCSNSWDKFAMQVAPDYSCRTGADGGYDFYVWDCHQNQRIVIYKWTASFSCREPQRETVGCGATTSIEDKIGFRLDKTNPNGKCGKIPDNLQWQTK